MKVCLKYVCNKYKRDIRTAIRLIIKDYPILRRNIYKIHVEELNSKFSNRFATHHYIYHTKIQSVIKLNFIAFSNNNLFDKLKQVDLKKSKCFSIQDIFYHEIGHCLQLYMLCDELGLNLKKYKYKYMQKYYNILESDKRTGIYINHMNTYLNEFSWNKQTASYYLGTYGIDNPEEFFPECFCNYYRLKNKQNLDDNEQILFNFVKTVVGEYNDQYLKSLY